LNKIHILSEDVRNKIAAGEVIERPVSVVKELVENAIDASATQISVHVENGGKDLIQVTDNGDGMSEDDALLAFERHATSKIRTVDDIIRIDTLGFRGEALPSIASVSRLTLITRSQDAPYAMRLEFADGRLLEETREAANPGTTVSVKGLFKNLPAPRKFLRSDMAELKHTLRYFHYQSLLYPEITFRLSVNGREKLHYKQVLSIQARLADVFGSGFFEQDIIPLEAVADALQLSGYIFGLEELKQTLLDERYLFINGRYINDRTVTHSIRSAYAPFIAKTRLGASGQTPPYILFLNIPPEMIDFNVHPAKQEVRFRDQQQVHGFVKSAVTQALTRYEEQKFQSAKAKFTHASALGKATSAEKEIYKSRIEIPRFSQYKKELGNLYQPEIFKSQPPDPPRIIPVSNPQKAEDSDQTTLFPEQPNDSFQLPILSKNEEEYVNPWQLHNTYIFIQIEDGLVIIDQHAAHERILYERLTQRMQGAPAVRQKLLFPLVIDVPPFILPVLQEQVEQQLEQFERIGFSLKKFSGQSLVVEEIPAELDDWQGGQIFVEILRQLQDELEVNPDFRDSLAKSIACKAAIKAGNPLSKKEMLNLINELFACRIPYFCPHGRPLIIKMTLTEFEKRFKRIE